MKTKITLLVLFIVSIHTLYSQDAGITNPVNNLIIHEDNRSSYFLTNDLDKMRIDGWSNTGSISTIQIFGMRGSSPNTSTDINYYYAENANTGSWYKDIDIDPGTHDIYINVRCNYAGCLQNGTNSQPRHFTYVKPYEKSDFYLERTNDNKVKITLFADYGIGGLNTGFYYRVFRNTTPSFGGGTYIGDWSQTTQIIDTQVNEGETYYYWVDVAMNNGGSYNSGLLLNEYRSITLEANAQTYVPDDNFENYLETHGMGNGIADDNYVTTSNINGVTVLEINFLNISDLTGIEDFISLEKLSCSRNQISSLDMSKNPSLKELNCDRNQITSLNVASNLKLERLDCWTNNLTNLNVSSNVNLKRLHCASNQISSLNVTNNTLLVQLLINVNPIKNIDVSALVNLLQFQCNYAQLNSLDLTNNKKLYFLSCSGITFSNLDLSQNTALTALYCKNNNNLTSLNIKNTNNTNFTIFEATDNLKLTCIEVDNAVWSNENWTIVDSTTNFSEDCSTLSLNDELLKNLSVSPNPANKNIKIVANNVTIKNITIYDVNGRLLQTLKNSFENISLKELSQGMYIFKIETDKGITSKEIIKN